MRPHHEMMMVEEKWPDFLLEHMITFLIIVYNSMLVIRISNDRNDMIQWDQFLVQLSSKLFSS